MIYNHKNEDATVKRNIILDKFGEWHWFCCLKVSEFAWQQSIYNSTLSLLETENPKIKLLMIWSSHEST